MGTQSVVYITGKFTFSIQYFVLALFERSWCLFFNFYKSISHETTQWLKQHQRNINYILISSSRIESMSGIYYTAYNIIEGITVWTYYGNYISLATYGLIKEGDIRDFAGTYMYIISMGR